MKHASLLYLFGATAVVSLLFFIFFDSFSALFPIAVAIVPITVSLRAARGDEATLEQQISDEHKRSINRALALGFGAMALVIVALLWWALQTT